MTIEYLKLKGENAISIPISRLSSVENVEKEIIRNPGTEKYFEYLKTLGFDITKLDPNTTYVFTDFAVTGQSLKVFEQLIKSKLPQEAKCQFVKLQDIPRKADLRFTPEQLTLMEQYEEELYARDITRRCSPIESVPYQKMGNIQQICERANIFGGYINQLKLLLYDIAQKS